MLVNAVRPRVFVLDLGLLVLGLGLLFLALRLRVLVVDAVQGVDVLLDRIPGGAPHLVDEEDDSDQEQEEDTGQNCQRDDYIEEGVVLHA